MDARTMTIVSGIILLAVFALAGWASKRRRTDANESSPDHHDQSKRKAP